MSNSLVMQSTAGRAPVAIASRILPRVFIGLGVLLIHGAGLMYVQAVEADQVAGNVPAMVQPLQCQRPRSGDFA